MLRCLRLIWHRYVPWRTYFVNDIFSSTTYYSTQYIMFNNVFCETTYISYPTYMSNNIYVCINNIYILLNFIRHIYILYPWTTYIYCILEQRICDRCTTIPTNMIGSTCQLQECSSICARRFRASLLPHTTCVRSYCNWHASCLVASLSKLTALHTLGRHSTSIRMVEYFWYCQETISR